MELAPFREMESPTMVTKVSTLFLWRIDNKDSVDIESANCVTGSRINVLLIERTAAVYIIIIFELHALVTELRNEVTRM